VHVEYGMEYLLFDIETPGLQPNEIFMIVIMNLVTRERDTYIGLDEVAIAIDRLSRAKMVAGHYIKGFDLKVIADLTEVQIPKNKVVDTLELSKKFCRLDRHGLKAWGKLVDLPKLHSPLFERFTPEMIPYCERDVDLNTKVFDVLVEIMLEQERFPEEYAIIAEYLEELLDSNTMMLSNM
jgi:hypothetical protein